VSNAGREMSTPESGGTPGGPGQEARRVCRGGGILPRLALLGVAGGALLACSPRDAVEVEVSETPPPPPFELRETGQGVEVRDSGALVLFYQREPKDHEGQYARNNYVHPLMSLDGDVLTEDFPEDHLHQRGIFWAWHQLWDGEERLGDGWTLEGFVTDVTRVETGVTDGTARLESEVEWRSPHFRGGAPFIEERTAITVHRVAGDARVIDFEIALRAVAPGIRIGGSEDAKGYGGFSVRVRMPDGLVFTGEGGPVSPEELQVEAGPWVDLSAPYGEDGARSGVTILVHPTSPGYPQPWILRQKASMQNPVFPGREAVSVPADRPLVLRYRLVVHRGTASGEEIQRWQADYAGRSAAPGPGRP
jgi:hypothetical protein